MVEFSIFLFLNIIIDDFLCFLIENILNFKGFDFFVVCWMVISVVMEWEKKMDIVINI